MSVLEELGAQFEALNVTVTEKVLKKCAELCATYTIDSEDFIDQWLAYTASNLNGAPPSLDVLDKMERKELKKQSRTFTTPKLNRSEIETPTTTPVRQNLQEVYEESPVSQVADPNFLNAPSEDFAKRSDAGTVQHTFGDVKPDSFKSKHNGPLLIKILNEEMTNSHYMHEKFLSKQATLNGITRWVVTDIINHYKLEVTREKLKQYSGEMVICGRIYSDTLGKLELGSVQIEGLLDIYRGQRLKLNLSKVEKLALFCGQSLVVTGNNMKDRFMVKELFTGAPLPLPEKPISLKETLQIIIAAGPFTLPENLLYEPLENLLKHVTEFKPNLLILMGPFIDRTHPHLQDISESYNSFFERMVDGIMQQLHGTGVQVILVPSNKDIHNHIIFPSVPYSLKKRHNNLFLVPNPFIIDIDGLIIGGSTTDILFHLSKAECSKNYHGDRIGRMITHLFNQRSFYPLHQSDPDVRVDYQLVEQFAMFETAPHLVILPSNFRYFMKNVEESIAINPERLIKGNGAGTFARVEVRAEPLDDKITNRVSCQIFQI